MSCNRESEKERLSSAVAASCSRVPPAHIPDTIFQDPCCIESSVHVFGIAWIITELGFGKVISAPSSLFLAPDPLSLSLSMEDSGQEEGNALIDQLVGEGVAKLTAGGGTRLGAELVRRWSVGQDAAFTDIEQLTERQDGTDQMTG